MEPVGELAAKPPSCHSVPTVPNGAESGDLIVGDVVDLELAGVVVAQNQVGGAPTRTFSTRCVTANLRRIDLRISGDDRRSRRAAGLANWATARAAPAVEPQALISRKSPRRFKPNFKSVSRPRGKHPAVFWRQAQHSDRLCGLPTNMPTKTRGNCDDEVFASSGPHRGP